MITKQIYLLVNAANDEYQIKCTNGITKQDIIDEDDNEITQYKIPFNCLQQAWDDLFNQVQKLLNNPQDFLGDDDFFDYIPDALNVLVQIAHGLAITKIDANNPYDYRISQKKYIDSIDSLKRACILYDARYLKEYSKNSDFLIECNSWPSCYAPSFQKNIQFLIQ